MSGHRVLSRPNDEAPHLKVSDGVLCVVSSCRAVAAWGPVPSDAVLGAVPSDRVGGARDRALAAPVRDQPLAAQSAVRSLSSR